jgi:hypothetical protein
MRFILAHLIGYIAVLGASVVCAQHVSDVPMLPTPIFARDSGELRPVRADVLRRELADRISGQAMTAARYSTIETPGLKAGGESTPEAAHTLPTVSDGGPTLLKLDDNSFARISQDYLPVMLDWFASFSASMNVDTEVLKQRGFDTGRVVRLMRALASISCQKKGGASARLSPAIGWCRMRMYAEWGEHQAGSTADFILVATDRGWAVVDPFSRSIRDLRAGDTRWGLMMVVM